MTNTVNGVKVVTNNTPRQVMSYCDIPEKYLGDIEEGEEGYYVLYKGICYNLSEDFMRFDGDGCTFGDWDCYYCGSAFHAVVCKYCEDTDYIIMGTVFSN